MALFLNNATNECLESNQSASLNPLLLGLGRKPLFIAGILDTLADPRVKSMILVRNYYLLTGCQDTLIVLRAIYGLGIDSIVCSRDAKSLS